MFIILVLEDFAKFSMFHDTYNTPKKTGDDLGCYYMCSNSRLHKNIHQLVNKRNSRTQVFSKQRQVFLMECFVHNMHSLSISGEFQTACNIQTYKLELLLKNFDRCCTNLKYSTSIFLFIPSLAPPPLSRNFIISSRIFVDLKQNFMTSNIRRRLS